MNRMTGIILTALFCIGCSTNNEITINNKAQSSIEFHFRADKYTVAAGDSETVSDIPNGSFTYGTIFSVPFGVKSYEAAEELSGTMSFTTSNTKTRIAYSSAVADSVYSIGAVITSADRNSSNPVGTAQ
jgi:hypothetical protein